jgi:hypothetical protein
MSAFFYLTTPRSNLEAINLKILQYLLEIKSKAVLVTGRGGL